MSPKKRKTPRDVEHVHTQKPGWLGNAAGLTLCLHHAPLCPSTGGLLSAPQGFQTQYLWNPTSMCLLRKLKDKEASRAGLLKCITLGRLSKGKKRGAATKGQGFEVRLILDYADSITEKDTVL